jgi:hypothetical protein
MSTTNRQNNLFLSEDWRTIYQSFRNADFTSYDFENIRRVMINYLRLNYPEDFNDYIESSEYLALIDLIAYLGQSLAFRIDVNARENFLELAERRESVLRLARLLSYNVKRNVCASGLLKVESISTTEDIIDSSGRSLQNIQVSWNDNTNSGWFDQYTKIINASMIPELQFGIPQTYSMVDGIYTEQYRLNSQISDIPVFPYSKSIDGRNFGFEVVSTTIKNHTIMEETPLFGRRIAMLYRDDQVGYGSNNTGWFMHFRQGTLQQREFTINTPTTNQIVDITDVNINNDDVWLYGLNQNNAESVLWTQVPAVVGNNVIYNSVDKTIRNIYSVQTAPNDAVSLVFGDGIFANLPRGTFRAYYRVSNGLSYTINPRDMKGIVVSIPYLSVSGSVETLSMNLALMSSVTTASATETNQEVKNNAPSTYYTQNRMITGEDYNLAPLGVSQNIAKVKAVNRTTSGISRNFDLVDPTGQYSTTSSFCTDGIIYKEDIEHRFDFTFNSRSEIQSMIKNQIEPIIKLSLMRDFYYAKYDKKLFLDVTLSLVTVPGYNGSTAYVIDQKTKEIQPVGSYSSGTLRYFEPGAMVKLVPPAGKFFAANGTLVSTQSSTTSDRLWTKVIQITGDGKGYNSAGLLVSGLGPIALSGVIPTGAIIAQVIPKFLGYIPSVIQSLALDLIFNRKNFGLRFSIEDRTWYIIQDRNLNLTNSWSYSNAGNNDGAKLDSSWVIAFETDGQKYTITYRGLEYYFESILENRFFFDGTRNIYDITTGKLQKDKVSVLKFNTLPNSNISISRDYPWKIVGTTSESDGYTSTKAVKITFFDANDDSIPDFPDAFDIICNPPSVTVNNTLTNSNFVFFEKFVTNDYTEDYRYVSNDDGKFITNFINENLVTNLSSYTDGQLFYFYQSDVVKKFNKVTSTFITTRDYYANPGRSSIYFHYLHNAESTARIDPAASNIMDIFLLTKDYDNSFRQYIKGNLYEQPLPPSSTQLRLAYGNDLDKIKSISDDIVYHPVRYKLLFGSQADRSLQASFKVVKNTENIITNNDIKTRVIFAINQYFALDNWNFGDSFYFSELSAYVMNRLVPYITSFVIVPVNSDQVYGSLQQISSAPNEIFISSATTNDVEIIESLTASKLKTAGYIVTTSISDVNSTNIISSTSY